MRYPLIDQNSIVVNIVEMEVATARDWKPPRGLTLAPASTTAQVGDLFDGKDYIPQPKPERKSFYARDLVSLWTPADTLTVIGAASRDGQIALWLEMLRSRGEKPIDLASPTFTQAWGALTAVLGQERADELLAQLKGV